MLSKEENYMYVYFNKKKFLKLFKLILQFTDVMNHKSQTQKSRHRKFMLLELPGMVFLFLIRIETKNLISSQETNVKTCL